ncbi:MAG: hypothetical protein ACLFN9_22670, partial [Desulfococcaceae bacterium]
MSAAGGGGGIFCCATAECLVSCLNQRGGREAVFNANGPSIRYGFPSMVVLFLRGALAFNDLKRGGLLVYRDAEKWRAGCNFS